MHHPLLIPLLFAFFITPTQMVQQMLRNTVVDLPLVELAGETGDEPPAPVALKYDRAKDEVTLTVAQTPSVMSKEGVTPWLRLFFLPPVAKDADPAEPLMARLSKLGINTEKKVLSTTGPGGELILIIGKERADEDAPHLALYRSGMLPFRLSYGETTVTFGEYHKSVLPLAFPGTVEIREPARTVRYRFLRNEYR
ncbi:MAG TPA: hypothetical protein P5077_09665 [bacterium]|nr:hypothetical protein [bacterium]